MYSRAPIQSTKPSVNSLKTPPNIRKPRFCARIRPQTRQIPGATPWIPKKSKVAEIAKIARSQSSIPHLMPRQRGARARAWCDVDPTPMQLSKPVMFVREMRYASLSLLCGDALTRLCSKRCRTCCKVFSSPIVFTIAILSLSMTQITTAVVLFISIR